MFSLFEFFLLPIVGILYEIAPFIASFACSDQLVGHVKGFPFIILVFVAFLLFFFFFLFLFLILFPVLSTFCLSFLYFFFNFILILFLFFFCLSFCSFYLSSIAFLLSFGPNSFFHSDLLPRFSTYGESQSLYHSFCQNQPLVTLLTCSPGFLPPRTKI